MKKQQLDHVLRAAGRVTGEKQFIVIGSQSLHAKHADLPDEFVTSFEVDLIAKNDPGRTFQEMADIRFLLQLPRVDRQEVRGYFARHGLEERFDDLEKSL